jgi:hypothetical protein
MAVEVEGDKGGSALLPWPVHEVGAVEAE